MPVQTARKSRGNLPTSVAKILLVPIGIVTLVLVWEASYELYLHYQLLRIVTGVARNFSAEYHHSSGFVADIASQEAWMDKFHYPLVFQSNQQMKVNWQLGQLPISLTVSATYLVGVGNPPLPSYAVFDPFHWFSGPIKASTTIAL